MKTYTITVNGKAYAVTVEEGAASPASASSVHAASDYAPPAHAASAASAHAAPAASAHAASAPSASPEPAGASGSIQLEAPMPGKVVALKGVVGQAVKKGDVILVLEAMKMENDIVAPQDATIASVNVSTGDSVESGAVLATLN